MFKTFHLILCLQLGYAVLDLEILNESKIEDICLSKFIALVLKVLQLSPYKLFDIIVIFLRNIYLLDELCSC